MKNKDLISHSPILKEILELTFDIQQERDRDEELTLLITERINDWKNQPKGSSVKVAHELDSMREFLKEYLEEYKAYNDIQEDLIDDFILEMEKEVEIQ